jgi:hypothetical protein
MNRSTTKTLVAGGITVAALALVPSAYAVLEPGTPAKDITVGLDNDNTSNPFIQPPGVAANQSMNNTDVLFGRDNDDLLIGKLGSDTLLAGEDEDILIGGPEKGQAPNSDVLVGEEGNDINIWAPGDGSDAFAGNEGRRDTMIFAPFVEQASGELLLTDFYGRQVPRVAIDEQPAFSCTIVPVPDTERLGAQFLVRFNVNGTPVVTVRQKDVERLFCPSPTAGHAQFADLTDAAPALTDVRLSRVRGTVGAILAPVE